jgi:transcriptional regulator with XRE-family HTH domain
MVAMATGAAAQCQRADFEAVVDEAAGALRDLNAANKPKFQEKLRRLKEKRGWSQEQFLKEAAPLVADDTIAAHDRQSSELLSRIAAGGEEGAAAATPDCAMLTSLRDSLRVLVEAQTSKWTHMNGKIDGELAK